MESLDIRRPALATPRQSSALYRCLRDESRRILRRKEARRLRRAEGQRLVVHLVAATLPALRERAKRKHRLWPWLLAVYGTPIVLALSVGIALWVLRRMV